MEDSDDGDDGGIDGRTIALGALAVTGILLVVRVLRGRGGEEESDEEGFEFDDESGDETAPATDDDGLAMDAIDSEGVSERFDEIDVVDAVYILVAGLKAAREEYRTRTDDGGA